MAKMNHEAIDQFLVWLEKAQEFHDENHEDTPRGCQTCDSDRGCRCDYIEDERTGN